MVVWGHSAGAALGLAAARALTERGIAVHAVLLGAQLPRDPAARQAWIEELDADNAEIIGRPRGDHGDPALAELDACHAEHVVEHIARVPSRRAASRYILDAPRNPPADQLSSPVTMVVAADDPSTADYASRYTDWYWPSGPSRTGSPAVATTSRAPGPPKPPRRCRAPPTWPLALPPGATADPEPSANTDAPRTPKGIDHVPPLIPAPP